MPKNMSEVPQSESPEKSTARFYQQYDQLLDRCTPESLSPQLTHMITFACHLATCRCDASTESFQVAVKGGATPEQLNMVACLCACTGGPMVQDNYMSTLRAVRRLDPAGFREIGAALPAGFTSLRAIGSAPASREAYSLDENLFETSERCSEKSLEKKDYHLVALASCLVTRCSCAAGHIIEARNAGATIEELARCACIASCVSGLQNKYAFLEALRSVENCSACDC